MNDWQSPKVTLPPQGVKILWFTNGDVFVAQRFGTKYLCLQPGEAKVLEAPMLWMKCPVPDPYEGIIHITVEGNDKLMTVDEMEKEFPKEYKELLDAIGEFKFKERT